MAEKNWRAARENLERGAYQHIEALYREGKITLSEAIDRKSKVEDDIREKVRHAIAVSERGS